MYSDMKITTEEVSQQLSNFQSEMAKMDNLFEELTTKTSAVKSDGTGTASDNATTAISNFMKVFEDIDEQNKKYVAFLNEVIMKYTTTDQAISDVVDEAANGGLGMHGSSN